jgi:SpoVK/Ycf46/Vps4 family AAA+-type ATPase
MDFLQKIDLYRKACYAGLAVLTHEEARLVPHLKMLKNSEPTLSLYEWDNQSGLTGGVVDQERYAVPSTAFPKEVLQYIQKHTVNNTIFVLKDFHLEFDRSNILRLLRNSWDLLKSRRNMIIFVSHKYALPPEIEKEVQIVDYDLPDAEAIEHQLSYIHECTNKAREAKSRPALSIPDEIKDAAIDAAKGMTFAEIESAFSLAIIKASKFDQVFVEAVFHEKIAHLKKNGLLTYMEPNVSFDNVGGLVGLKTWISARKKAYSKEAREYNLPMPKGMLLASVPGTGKSLICKAIAKEFDCPLFALDIGSIFDSLVGNSEKNMRELIKTVNGVGRCVILIDEIEKSLSNTAVSGSGDSGVSSRIFGTFLTWLNDRTNPAFIVATTNDHTKLPAALIRKGRFDQLFWLDLPTLEERKEIFSVVIKKYGRNVKDFSVSSHAASAVNFTGAEIEEVFKDAMYKAFNDNKDVSDNYLIEALAEFIPFAVSHEEDLKTMRRQAQGKLVMITAKGDPIADVQKNMRKLSIAIGSDDEE